MSFAIHRNGIIGNWMVSLVLDKITWLGETLQTTELVLKMLYPQLAQKDMVKAWAAHVEDGIAALRNYRSLRDFSMGI
ncbi:DndE family protein [Escherichia coli]